ncbi:protein of unknown function [Desulfovibrio sp. 86]|nr:protein of unknown function [Desulfovibrio sp. 86]
MVCSRREKGRFFIFTAHVRSGYAFAMRGSQWLQRPLRREPAGLPARQGT